MPVQVQATRVYSAPQVQHYNPHQHPSVPPSVLTWPADGGDYNVWLAQVSGVVARHQPAFSAGGATLSLQQVHGNYWIQVRKGGGGGGLCRVNLEYKDCGDSRIARRKAPTHHSLEPFVVCVHSTVHQSAREVWLSFGSRHYLGHTLPVCSAMHHPVSCWQCAGTMHFHMSQVHRICAWVV